jgi:hypothetical protein
MNLKNKENGKLKFIKQFPGDPRTGGEKLLPLSAKLLSNHFDLEIVDVCPYFLYYEGKYRSYFFSNAITILRANFKSLLFNKKGFTVLGENCLADFLLVQPVNSNRRLNFMQKLLELFTKMIEKISEFGAFNSKLEIYVSEYALQKHKIKNSP